MKKIFLAAFILCSFAANAQQQKLVDMRDGSITNRLFFDGQWRYRWMSNSVISGGVVSWVSGFTFAVTSATFTIAGREYTSAGGQITLDPAHPSLSRFDVIALNTAGQIIKITGTPSPIPAVPQVTPATQVYLTAILVGGGSTSPGGVSNLMIYDENIEWLHDDGGFTAGINFASTASPYSGSKSIDITAQGPSGSGSTAGMKFSNNTVYAYSNYSLLRFYLKLKTALPSSASIQVALGEGNEQMTTLGPAQGFNPLLAGSYQNITIPISDFNKLGNSFEAFYISTTRNTVGFYIDKIELQSGISSGGGTTNATDTILVDSPLHIFKNSATGAYKVNMNPVSSTADGYLTAAQFNSLGGGSGSQTPYTSDHDAAQFSVNNIKGIEVKKAIAAVPATTTQNAATYSEDQANAVYSKNHITAVNNSFGNLALITIDAGGAGDNELFLPVTVTPGTNYTVSFDYKRGTATDGQYFVTDFSSCFCALVARTQFYTSTSPTGTTRVTFTFNSAGATLVRIYLASNNATVGTFYAGRLQVAESALYGYVTTTTTAAPITTTGGSPASSFNIFSTDTAGVITMFKPGTTFLSPAQRLVLYGNLSANSVTDGTTFTTISNGQNTVQLNASAPSTRLAKVYASNIGAFWNNPTTKLTAGIITAWLSTNIMGAIIDSNHLKELADTITLSSPNIYLPYGKANFIDTSNNLDINSSHFFAKYNSKKIINLANFTTAIGYNTLNSVFTGNGTYFGANILTNATTAAGTTAIGNNIAANLVSGNNNIFIGSSTGSGSFAPSTLSNSILLGTQADAATGIDNAVAIGNKAVVTQSNAIVIGATPGVNAGTASYVGIGKQPTQKLDVNGALKLDSILYLPASNSTNASVNMPVGSNPATPVAGDIWRIGDNRTSFKIRINGNNETINLGDTSLVTGGVANAYTLTPVPAITTFLTGVTYNVVFNIANTGASTIVVSGLGAKNITKGGAVAVASGDIVTAKMYTIVYDGTQFQLLNAGGATTGSGAIVQGTTPTLATPVINGLPTGTGVASAATASTVATRDASANIKANNFNFGFATTATAASTTTLVVGSKYCQVFTGATTQTVVMPAATTLVAGMEFKILNNSTGIVTVQKNGGTVLKAMAAGSSLYLTVTDISTAAGVYSFEYSVNLTSL